MGRKQFMIAAAALGVLGATAVLAQDQPKATGVVAVRQSTMKANADHMGAIKAILTEAPDLIGQIEFHAEAIKEAAEYTPAMFPAGSDQPASWALPPVWSDAAGFKAAAEKSEDLAGKLADTAKGGDPKATLAAFATLGKEGCGGCHQTFRKKES
ncbi:MAG: c-type cytochrome [Geminicoccaceae bacterium]